MTKPENFILTSDYATLKNDATEILTVTWPGGYAIPTGATVTFSETKTVGVPGAAERAQIHSSKIGTRYLGSILSVDRPGTTLGSPITYTMIVEIQRTSPTQVTASVSVRSPYIADLITEAGDETFTFYLATFLPPFA